jgi:hypothetical protein
MEFAIATLIVALFCGFGCIVIIENKGYPKSKNGMWFAIGYLFSFFGLIAAALSPSQTAGHVESGKMKDCSFCKELILADAILCKHCGSKLD